MNAENKRKLLDIADALDDAKRVGLSVDKPEGVRWIRLGDTIARQMAQELRDIVNQEPER